MPLVYDDLRRIAHHQLLAERAGHTLSTTAVVHEAFLKLADQTRARFVNRAQFFAVAARAMRRVLIDYARRHRALRRGAAPERVPLEDEHVGDLAAAARADELMALDEALERLASVDRRLARVVELRYFGGRNESEIAAILRVTPRTVGRWWVMARGWLYQELRNDGD